MAPVILVLAAACAQGPAPAYVRIRGAAPKLSDVPAARGLLVVFWASWCAPCREEAPSLQRLADRPPADLAVVVFGHGESPEAVRDFYGGDPPPSWRFRPDRDEAVARSFGIEALPAGFLVVDGRLKARFAGSRDWDSRQMRRLLDRLVREGGTGS